MTCGPGIPRFPGSPGGPSREGLSTSTIRGSVSGNGRPIPSLTVPTRGFAWVTGDASVRPYPSTSFPPVTFSHSRRTSFGRAPAPGEPRGGLEGVGHEVPVGQHGALRGPGGPARVLEDRDVLPGAHPGRLPRGRRRQQVRVPVDPRLLRDREGPMALLPQVLLLLDRIELAEGRLQVVRAARDDDVTQARRGLRLRDVVPEQVEDDGRLDAR